MASSRRARALTPLRVIDRYAERTFQYIPFGGEIHAERRFGELVLPSSVSVGWWFHTPRYEPFFRAEISAVTPTS